MKCIRSNAMDFKSFVKIKPWIKNGMENIFPDNKKKF